MLATEYEGERIYRPYCGAPSIIGRPGVKYRNARYNGKPIEFADSIIGGVNVNGDEFETTKATEDQLPPGLADNPRRAEEFYSNCFITIKGDGTENYTYEVEAFAEEGKPFTSVSTPQNVRNPKSVMTCLFHAVQGHKLDN